MNKCFELTEKFVEKCNEIEMEFAYSISESMHEGVLSHDSNYRESHHQAFGDLLDVYLEFRGKVPEPLFSEVFSNLQETISTDCGWE